MEEPTRFERLTREFTTPNPDLGGRTPLEAGRDCGITSEEVESAIRLLITSLAAYALPQESDVLPEHKDGFVGARSPDIKEGMRYKGGVNPPSTMPRPSEPPKPFDPGWKSPPGRGEAL